MTIDTAKANGVYLEAARKELDHLQAESQTQNDRLQLAADAKHNLDATLHTQLPSGNRVFWAK